MIFDALGRLTVGQVSDSGAAASYTLTAEVQTYSETGINTTVLKALKLIAATTTYTEIGIDALFKRGIILVTDVQTYQVSGLDTIVREGFILNTESITYELGLISSSIYKGLGLVAQSKEYNIVGIDTLLKWPRTIITESKNYNIADIDLFNLGIGKRLITTPELYNIVLENILINRNYILTFNETGFQITGIDENLLLGKKLLTQPQVYILQGINLQKILESFIIQLTSRSYLISTNTIKFKKRLIDINPYPYRLYSSSGDSERIYSVTEDRAEDVEGNRVTRVTSSRRTS